jgi:hypothetical protein
MAAKTTAAPGKAVSIPAAKFRGAVAGVTEPAGKDLVPDSEASPEDREQAERIEGMRNAGRIDREDREDLRHRLSIPPPGVNAPGEDLTPPAERAARDGRAPRTRAQIYNEMDPQEWACRASEHYWPQLVPGATELPPGMRVSAAGAGNVLFEADCLHGCGRYREELTERGFIVISRRYGTRPGHRHTVVHRDESMTKTEMREDVYGANKKLLEKAVKAATAAARQAARDQAAEARAAAKAAS